jgi:hypothetical protein
MKITRWIVNIGALEASLGVGILAVSAIVAPSLRAQNPEMQQRVAEVKESMAVNKQLLAQYTWMEQDIISIKGDEKKEELYNVQLGPNGKPQKTPVDPSSVWLANCYGRADFTGNRAAQVNWLSLSERVSGELLRGPILPANRAAKGRCLSLFERTW